MNKTSCMFEVIRDAIRNNECRLSVLHMCEVAGVSRSGYYAWLKAEGARNAKEKRDRKDFDRILQAYKQRGYSKGAKGISMSLSHMNPPVVMNLKKIRRLMHKYRLYCPIRKANPYRQLAKELRTDNVSDDILHREFESYGPRIVLLTDITYLSYNGTFAYLSVILDAFTKQILSYVLSDSLRVDFVLETIEKLTNDPSISLNEATIVHSDQGCHYTSHRFIEILRDKKLRQSMCRKGNCWDNAPLESFWGGMKDHIGDKLKTCTKFSEVKSVVDDYMDYYNNERYQWKLAKLSPNEYYEFYVTRVYPLKLPNPPAVPRAKKAPEELGRKRYGGDAMSSKSFSTYEELKDDPNARKISTPEYQNRPLSKIEETMI